MKPCWSAWYECTSSIPEMESREDSHQSGSQARCSGTCILCLTFPSRARFPHGYQRHNRHRRLESKRRYAPPPRYPLAATMCESSFFSPFPPDCFSAATTTTLYTESRRTTHQSLLRSFLYSSYPYTHETSTYILVFRPESFSLPSCPTLALAQSPSRSPSPSLAIYPKSSGTRFSSRRSRTRSV